MASAGFVFSFCQSEWKQKGWFASENCWIKCQLTFEKKQDLYSVSEVFSVAMKLSMNQIEMIIFSRETCTIPIKENTRGKYVLRVED